MQRGTLHFISGKLAVGKTTLARKLAVEHRAVLVGEDIWLSLSCLMESPLSTII
jgi:predicted kinase